MMVIERRRGKKSMEGEEFMSQGGFHFYESFYINQKASRAKGKKKEEMRLGMFTVVMCRKVRRGVDICGGLGKGE